MLKRFIRQFMQTALAMAVTYPAGNWAVQYAYAVRNYEAVGGEYLFIPVVYLIVYAGCSRLMDIPEQIRCRRNIQRQPIQAEHENKGAAERC